jgi:hypothetical protein
MSMPSLKFYSVKVDRKRSIEQALKAPNFDIVENAGCGRIFLSDETQTQCDVGLLKLDGAHYAAAVEWYLQMMGLRFADLFEFLGLFEAFPDLKDQSVITICNVRDVGGGYSRCDYASVNHWGHNRCLSFDSRDGLFQGAPFYAVIKIDK